MDEINKSYSRDADLSRFVYVCNIPYDCKWQDLKSLFKDNVGKDNVTYVHIVKEGCAVVEFLTKEVALQAINIMNRQVLDGRKIVVKKLGNKIISKLGGNAFLGMKDARGRRVYVCNIPYKYKSEELKALFEREVGDVVAVEAMKNGCAYIEFKNSDLVSKAIESMNKHEINGRNIIVREESRKLKDIPSLISIPSYDPMYLSRQHSSLSSMGAPGILGPIPISRPAAAVEMTPFMYNLNNSCLPKMLNGCSNIYNPTITANIQSKPLTTLETSKYGETYGLSTEFLKSKGITGPLTKKVFFANIDYKVEEKSLKELFKIAGSVLSIELKKDDDGKSKGFGFVEYEHPVEAVQAISMLHKQIYFDRKLSVQMAKDAQYDLMLGRHKGRHQSSIKLPKGLQSLGMGLGVSGTPMNNIPKLLDNP